MDEKYSEPQGLVGGLCNTASESPHAKLNRLQNVRITEQAELLQIKTVLEQNPNILDVVRLFHKYGIR